MLVVAEAVPRNRDIVNPGMVGLPPNLQIERTYDRTQAAFPGGPIPALVARAKDVTHAQDGSLDASTVRGVLLPPAATLLGGSNWCLPRLPGRLPRLRVQPLAPGVGGRSGGHSIS